MNLWKIFFLLIVLVIVISGCTQSPPPAKPVCGNGTIESGENCDGTGCPIWQTCNDLCKCLDSTVQPKPSRGFDMGFIPVPVQPITNQGWTDVFSLLGKNSDFVLHYTAVDWQAFTESGNAERSAASTPNLENTNFIVLMGKQNNLEAFIVIEPTRSDHEEIDDKLPASFGKNFGDEKARQAFKNFAVRIAKDYKPKYLGLSSEENTYMKNHPEDVENLVSLIKEAYALVKQESPETIVTAPMQFEVLNGTTDGTAQWAIFEKIEPVVDAVAITTYPALFFETPEKIPDNYYSQLKDHTNKPILIAESGWPTGGTAQYHGSEESQQRFLTRFLELTKGLDVKAWAWWFLHDWQGEGYPDYFKTMGLRTSSGEEKPAWKTWQEIFKLPNK